MVILEHLYPRIGNRHIATGLPTTLGALLKHNQAVMTSSNSSKPGNFFLYSVNNRYKGYVGKDIFRDRNQTAHHSHPAGYNFITASYQTLYSSPFFFQLSKRTMISCLASEIIASILISFLSLPNGSSSSSPILYWNH